MRVSERMRRNGIGDWNGVAVEALLSHGFLKRWARTLDFDSGELVFHGAP